MIKLLHENVWPSLTAAVKASGRPAYVAVAYLGKGATSLLPLKKNSVLVVDASEPAVKSGQTCPAELSHLLQKRAVTVYSAQNLHAKVFVIGSRAFIGSANVSRHSADVLQEAMLATSDRKAVHDARNYIRSLCLLELGAEELNRLHKLYRPPQFIGMSRSKRRSSRGAGVTLPVVRIAQLISREPPSGSEPAAEQGEAKARTLMERPRRHKLEEFFWSGDCPFKPGEIAVQVLEKERDSRLVSPPAKVIHTKKWRRGSERITFIYLEMPAKNRMALNRLAKRIGYGAKKRLLRGGRASNEFAQRLFAAWSGSPQEK